MMFSEEICKISLQKARTRCEEHIRIKSRRRKKEVDLGDLRLKTFLEVLPIIVMESSNGGSREFE